MTPTSPRNQLRAQGNLTVQVEGAFEHEHGVEAKLGKLSAPQLKPLRDVTQELTVGCPVVLKISDNPMPDIHL